MQAEDEMFSKFTNEKKEKGNQKFAVKTSMKTVTRTVNGIKKTVVTTEKTYADGTVETVVVETWKLDLLNLSCIIVVVYNIIGMGSCSNYQYSLHAKSWQMIVWNHHANDAICGFSFPAWVEITPMSKNLLLAFQLSLIRVDSLHP